MLDTPWGSFPLEWVYFVAGSIGFTFLLTWIFFRRRQPDLFLAYRAPLKRVLPITVIVLSLFAMYMYSVINIKVVPFTALLYGGGLAYYWFWSHGRIQRAAPEEIAARTGEVPPTRRPT